MKVGGAIGGQRADHRDRDVDGLGDGAALAVREGDLLRLGGDVARGVEHLELAVGADDVARLDQLAVEAVLDGDVERQLAGVVADRAQALDAVDVDLEVLDAVLDLGAARSRSRLRRPSSSIGLAMSAVPVPVSVSCS